MARPVTGSKVISRALTAQLLIYCASAGATDIPGVQAAAWDQPQINVALVRSDDTPIGGGVLDDYTFTAILDTGASGMIFNPNAAVGIDIFRNQCDGTDQVFSDVGVGGSTDYHVSETLEVRLAAFQPYVMKNEPSVFLTEFNQATAPSRLQIGPIGDTSFFPTNIFGMPAMAGKVTVVDTRHLDAQLRGDGRPDQFQLHTYLYDPGTPYSEATNFTEPGIPATDRHIALTLVDASRFTQTTPGQDVCPPPSPESETVTLADNPFIGPNPLAAIDADVPAGSVPGITVSLGGESATGSFLYDTGAAVSMISTAMAAQLHVRYRSGTYGTAAPVLEIFDPLTPETQGTAIDNQFTFEIAGAGGSATLAGFFLDSMLVRTSEGNPADDADPAHLNYIDFPVMVHDIALQDPDPDPGDGDTLVLDGVFGMNALVASVQLGGALNLEIIDQRYAPFTWLVFDQPNATLGLMLNDATDNDADDDGVRDYLDVCPLVADPGQANSDGDLRGDACDAFPDDPSETADADGDETGDNADPDDDNDSAPDDVDNCPLTANADQADADADGIGDACDYDVDGNGIEDALEVDECPDYICTPFLRGWRLSLPQP